MDFISLTLYSDSGSLISPPVMVSMLIGLFHVPNGVILGEDMIVDRWEKDLETIEMMGIGFW